ncbi:TMEM175 family protein [Nocardia sp. CDC153]|uniref:TMEM175 family protein n=1 Tax=Nocardia sp. CDC153 TaxID=3112167 RepID=UPI002DBAD19F|nr:TMEM175 family protein [Nocardia sp. CDC153]MEC3952807.1 TMEM175 family protein [Nocardia sp. CDC153]
MHHPDSLTSDGDSRARDTRLTDTTRVEAFSDGVMAIAITLLVLEIRLPETEGGDLWHELTGLWPSYLAYAGSFLTVGVIWLCHHRFFARIRTMDGLLHCGNLLLLFAVAFLPFPTAVLAHHLEDGGWNAKVATAFYGVVGALQAAAWFVMWMALRRDPDLFEPGYDAAYARRESMQAIVGFVVFDVIAAIGLLLPAAALLLYLVAVLGYGYTSTRNHVLSRA